MPIPIQNIVRTLTNHGDAWVALHNGAQSRLLAFVYSDEGNPNRVVEAVRSAIKMTGGTVRAAAPAELGFDFDEAKDTWTITSRCSGKAYSGECEGAALAKLLRKEPAALMAF